MSSLYQAFKFLAKSDARSDLLRLDNPTSEQQKKPRFNFGSVCQLTI